MSIGNFADPEYYMEARHDMEVAMTKSMDVIQKTCDEFAEIFGRQYGLVEPYKTDDAEIIYVAMGSLCSSIRVIVDELRAKGEKVGLLKIRSYRPFPVDAINEVVKNCSKLAVVDKNFAIGMGGALYGDMKLKIDKEIYGFITGLGGRDITPEALNEIYEITKNGPENDVTWIGLKEE
jgi:pyruvate ferredoxin oxidoreductase alpha subunit